MSPSFNLLAQSPLLAGVDECFIRQLAEKARYRVLKGRHSRIDSDELSHRLFMVISGEVHVLRVTADGQECLMQRVLPGDFFCLAAVVSGRSCGSQLACSGTTELAHWNHDFFQRLVGESEGLRNNLLRQMACQVEEERDMRTLSRCCKADVRVAAYLLHKLKSRRHCQDERSRCIDLKPISLTAQEIGMARETLTRSLQRLDRQQSIVYQRGRVCVDDHARLEAVLEESDCSCQNRRAF